MLAANRLNSFLSDLRSSGFSIGLSERQRVLDLLLYLETTDTMPQSSDRLCNMLGAILCSSLEQQAQFRRLFLNYFGTWKKRRGRFIDEPEEDEFVAPPDHKDEPSVWRALTRAERKILRRLASVVLFLFLLVAVTPIIVVILLPDIIPTEIDGRGQSPGPEIPRAPGQKSPDKQPPPRNGQQLPKKKSFDDYLQALPVVWSAVQQSLGGWLLLLLPPFFGIAAWWVVAPGRPFGAFLARRQVNYQPELLRLLAQVGPHNPFLTSHLHRNAQALRRPRLIRSTELDIERTFAATLDQAGLFTPVYAFRPIASEHLALIDRRSANDHVAHYADSLVRAMRQAQIYIDVYYFSGDLRRVSRSVDGATFTFEEIAGRHGDHRLILVTTGDRLFDLSNGKLEDWVQLVRYFERRVILTPTPKKLWGYREQTLQSLIETPVLELQPSSFSRMVELLTSEENPRLSPIVADASSGANALGQLADLLDERPLRWIDNRKPDDAVLAQLEATLSTGLSKQAREWLQAIAIYPELNWKLSLHLQALLSADQSQPLLPRDLLPVFCLPWLRNGRMPEWLRYQLANGMPAELYSRVRQILDSLLLTTLGAGTKNISFELGSSRSSINDITERLDRHVRDPVLIEFMTKRRRDRTSLKLPRMVARLLTGAGWIRNIFSTAQLEEIEATGEILRSTFDQRKVAHADVDEDPELGPDFRVVTRLLDIADREIGTSDPHYLYLPFGDHPARILDDLTMSIFLRRRRISRQAAFLNVLLILVLGATFHQSFEQFTNPGVAIVVAMLWITSPFFLLNKLLVSPVIKRFAHFPGFMPVDTGPRHLARKFDRQSHFE